MALSTQPYKGARDFYPEDKRIQKYMFGVMRRVVESFGYEEYDAPLLEPLELYAAKTGEEIVNEQTYTFTDRGDRKVAIRPEMTPTVSRMVAARRQELPYPVRWYSIPNLWRYERPQRGRLREHWQLNVDIFGVPGLSAEHEVIQIADALMQAYGAKRDMYGIKLNSRKLTDSFTKDYLGLNDEQAHQAIKLIDRMNKMERATFEQQATEIVGPEKSGKLFELLKVTNLSQLPEELGEHESVKELGRLLDMLQESGITNASFDLSLMRGFDYYTDIVFEVFDTNPENNRSMFGGGRYDGLVGLFGVEPVPTVGFGMGEVTLQNFLESHELMPKLPHETQVYVVLVGDVYAQVQPLIAELRGAGINVALDSTGRKPEKQIKSADKMGVQHVLFIGETELSNQKFRLKNLETGEEQDLELAQIIEYLK